jgi:hypothetical protein
VAGSCEHGNESSGSIKCGEFLDWLSVLLASQEGLCSMELVIAIYFFHYCSILVRTQVHSSMYSVLLPYVSCICVVYLGGGGGMQAPTRGCGNTTSACVGIKGNDFYCCKLNAT